MTSSSHGKNTSVIEVTGISAQGIWLKYAGADEFLSYDNFPWFKGKAEAPLRNVCELTPGHFHWPDLDVDLSIEIIRHPERYPLKSH